MSNCMKGQKMNKPLTIGKVARKAGVGIETIRFYERKGLIEKPPRKESGYRQFPVETVSRIRFIRQAKELGFTLEEIKELLSLKHDLSAKSGDVKMKVESKIKDIRGKIRILQNMEKILAELANSCDGCGSAGDCPILEALDSEEKP